MDSAFRPVVDNITAINPNIIAFGDDRSVVQVLALGPEDFRDKKMKKRHT